VLLLLATTGLITLDFWGVLIPGLMIALGGLTLWMVFTRSGELQRSEARVPAGSAKSATVRLRFGAGRLALGAGATPGELGRVEALGGVSQHSTTVGDDQSVEFWVPSDFLFDVLAPWKWSGKTPPSWDVSLAKGIPLRLEVQAGACEMNLDLTALTVRELRLTTGASSVMLRMPAAAGETKAHITAGAADVKVRIPDGVAARVRVPTGLGEVKVDRNRFPGGEGTFESRDFSTASNRIDLEVEVGAASADVS
jgi:hypothetical protein